MSKKLMKEREFFFAALYEFTRLQNLNDLQSQLTEAGSDLDVIGLLLIAEEGINGTVAGDEDAVRRFVKAIEEICGTNHLEIKFSRAVLNRMPFKRLKVKQRKEIVTMGVEGIDPDAGKGIYVEPGDWNALIQDPEVLLVDARNVYEYRIGTFQGAKDPKTHIFREFPAVMDQLIQEYNPKKIAMFCTGGIRCEKASAYVKQKLGIDEVYHLHGGILKYFEDVPTDKSEWKGNCFVFDGRITVNQELEAQPEPLCSVCGQVQLKDDQGEYECVQCREFPDAHHRHAHKQAQI